MSACLSSLSGFRHAYGATLDCFALMRRAAQRLTIFRVNWIATVLQFDDVISEQFTPRRTSTPLRLTPPPRIAQHLLPPHPMLRCLVMCVDALGLRYRYGYRNRANGRLHVAQLRHSRHHRFQTIRGICGFTHTPHDHAAVGARKWEAWEAAFFASAMLIADKPELFQDFTV